MFKKFPQINVQTARTVSPNNSMTSTKNQNKSVQITIENTTEKLNDDGKEITEVPGTSSSNDIKNSSSNGGVSGNSGANRTNQNTSNDTNNSNINENNLELEAFIRDWRHFDCKTWHLEPTVRLLSWAGKSIEPYGIDYILNKLGFSHARTTIPKWLQRGFMDPMDKMQSILMLQLLALVKENKNNENSSTKH